MIIFDGFWGKILLGVLIFAGAVFIIHAPLPGIVGVALFFSLFKFKK